MPTIPLLNHCPKCGQDKPFTAEFFHKDKTAKYGLSYTCKECAKAKARQWTADNREYSRQQAKAWYANNQDKVKDYRERNKPFRPAKRKESDRRYRQRYAKQLVQYNREYRAARPGWQAETMREWRQRNPERAKATIHRRLARLHNAPGSHTADDLRMLYADQDGRCAYCGITLHNDYHVDHMQPLSKDGSNAPDNLALTCSECNLSKNNKTFAEWQQVRGW